MTVLVHGATGAQGSPVLAALLASGADAAAAVRHPDAVADGVGTVAVDLSDADALAAAYSGAESVFVHLPMGTPDVLLHQAQALVTAIERARPRRVVISTSGQVIDRPESPLQAPEGAPIMTLVRGVAASGVSSAVVSPRLFVENLLLPVVADPACADGVLRYPLPEAFPVAWSSHADVAEVVVRLLGDESVTGVVHVGHDPGLVGADLAAAFAERRGHAVRYEGTSPAAFGALIAPLFGEAAGPVVDLYRALNAQPGFTIDPLRSAQTLLGIAPRPVAQRLAECGL